jgi:hypothetical protein
VLCAFVVLPKTKQKTQKNTKTKQQTHLCCSFDVFVLVYYLLFFAVCLLSVSCRPLVCLCLSLTYYAMSAPTNTTPVEMQDIASTPSNTTPDIPLSSVPISSSIPATSTSRKRKKRPVNNNSSSSADTGTASSTSIDLKKGLTHSSQSVSGKNAKSTNSTGTTSSKPKKRKKKKKKDADDKQDEHVFCANCMLELFYSKQTDLIECPKCSTTMDPTAPQQTPCPHCLTLLVHSARDKFIQCPRCWQATSIRQLPRGSTRIMPLRYHQYVPIDTMSRLARAFLKQLPEHIAAAVLPSRASSSSSSSSSSASSEHANHVAADASINAETFSAATAVKVDSANESIATEAVATDVPNIVHESETNTVKQSTTVTGEVMMTSVEEQAMETATAEAETTADVANMHSATVTATATKADTTLEVKSQPVAMAVEDQASAVEEEQETPEPSRKRIKLESDTTAVIQPTSTTDVLLEQGQEPRTESVHVTDCEPVSGLESSAEPGGDTTSSLVESQTDNIPQTENDPVPTPATASVSMPVSVPKSESIAMPVSVSDPPPPPPPPPSSADSVLETPAVPVNPEVMPMMQNEQQQSTVPALVPTSPTVQQENEPEIVTLPEMQESHSLIPTPANAQSTDQPMTPSESELAPAHEPEATSDVVPAAAASAADTIATADTILATADASESSESDLRLVSSDPVTDTV